MQRTQPYILIPKPQPRHLTPPLPKHTFHDNPQSQHIFPFLQTQSPSFDDICTSTTVIPTTRIHPTPTTTTTTTVIIMIVIIIMIITPKIPSHPLHDRLQNLSFQPPLLHRRHPQHQIQNKHTLGRMMIQRQSVPDPNLKILRKVRNLPNIFDSRFLDIVAVVIIIIAAAAVIVAAVGVAAVVVVVVIAVLMLNRDTTFTRPFNNSRDCNLSRNSTRQRRPHIRATTSHKILDPHHS
jgi:hypothetical protein